MPTKRRRRRGNPSFLEWKEGRGRIQSPVYALKWVNNNGMSSFNHADHTEAMESGEWVQAEPPPYYRSLGSIIKLCVHGFHVAKADPKSMRCWGSPGQVLWLVQVKGRYHVGTSKAAFRELRFIAPVKRWNPRAPARVGPAETRPEWDRRIKRHCKQMASLIAKAREMAAKHARTGRRPRDT